MIIRCLFKTMITVNLKSTNKLAVHAWRSSVLGLLLAIGPLVDEQITAAPSVIASQAPVPPFTTDWQQSQPDEMDVFTPFGDASANPLPQIFRYGSLQLRPHANYRFSYGNGIQSSPSNQQATAIHEISPGFVLDLGTHWAVDYTPTIRFYSNSKFGSTVDNALALTGGTQYEDWTFGFSHASLFTTTPLADTGGETEQATHATALTASRLLNSKMSADFGLNQQINLVSGYQDSYGWSTLDWLNYQFWPRLNAGLGAGGGYVKINDNSQTRSTENLDQTYEDLQARVNWRATEKISFQVSGGFEDRQFKTTGSGDSINPIYGVTIQYQPFKVTQITLSANRTVAASDYYLAAQQTESTVIGLNLNQRLFKRFQLGLGAGYTQTVFNTSTGSTFATGSAAANRTDDNYSFNVRLSHPFMKRGTWSVFYQYSDNQSSQPGFGFESNQMGFEIGYRY